MSFTRSARHRLIAAAGVTFAAFIALCVTAVQHVATLDDVDGWLDLSPATWEDGADWLRDPLVWIDRAFGTYPMWGYTIVTVAVLVWRRHHRAAIFALIAMGATFLLSPAFKAMMDRPRSWFAYDPAVDLPRYANGALPSGHAAYVAAAAGVATVLTAMFVRKRAMRRLAWSTAVLVALVVGLDRLLIGAHTLTDVVAGYLLGACVVLVTAYLFDPAPPLIAGTPLLSATRPPGKLACILNPIKVDDVDAFKTLVEDLALRSGYSEPDWYYTTVDDPGRSMAEAAAVSGASVVIVCGGDGTVRTVAGELAGTGIPLGVVPAGTGNLLARNAALPLYLTSAIDVGLNGQDRAIDLVSVHGDGIGPQEHYLVMAGMGLDAAIMESASDDLKAKVGWLAYVVSGARHMMTPAVRVEVKVDDGEWTRHRARTIVVGNVGNLQGGLPLMPDASVDDGLIDLVMINPRRFWSWLRVALRILSRSRFSDNTVTRMSGRAISIRAEKATPRQIDGDPVGAGHELHCQVLPGKLLIRVPR